MRTSFEANPYTEIKLKFLIVYENKSRLFSYAVRTNTKICPDQLYFSTESAILIFLMYKKQLWHDWTLSIKDMTKYRMHNINKYSFNLYALWHSGEGNRISLNVPTM